MLPIHKPSSKLISLICAVLFRGTVRRAPHDHVLHEECDEHLDLSKRDRLHQDTPILVKIALQKSNLSWAELWLNEVASPQFQNFGRYWAAKQVIEAFMPPQHAVDSAIDWLQSSGIHRDNVTHSDDKQWLVFPYSTQQAEDLLLDSLRRRLDD
ncbi:hypothetical protein GGP41_005820 [Bipolaris sorokiniana]|uniref:Peptidase S53 activation domain-containing protein n=1 Tax=Cochliobolus sativus TaxID=45130 RepID=A0A8H6DU32_COCSA|nr:hypothetical protein GGP41_005820 [Bipolaris sorokiniana]